MPYFELTKSSIDVIEARDALPKPLPESASTTEQPAKHHWWRHRVRPAVEQAKTDSVKAAKEAKKKADDKKIRPIDFLKSAGSGATSAIVGSLFGR